MDWFRASARASVLESTPAIMDNTDVRARHRCQFAEHEPLHVGISCPVCHRTVVEDVGEEGIKADIAVESHLARSCHRQQEETGVSKPSLVSLKKKKKRKLNTKQLTR